MTRLRDPHADRFPAKTPEDWAERPSFPATCPTCSGSVYGKTCSFCWEADPNRRCESCDRPCPRLVCIPCAEASGFLPTEAVPPW